jgi:DNA modification methylase
MTPEEQQNAFKDFLARHVKPYDPATDDYERPPFAADIKEGKNDPIYNAHSYHTKVPPRGIIPYILHYTKRGDLVLDPFCGSGMTGVAVQMCANPPADILEQFPDLKDRCGPRACVMSDLSPAACHIAYNYNTPVNVEALKHEFDRIKAAVKEEFNWLYGTEHYEPAVGDYDPKNDEVYGRLKNPAKREGESRPTLLLGNEHLEQTWELLTKAEFEERLGYSVGDLSRNEDWADLNLGKVKQWIAIPATIQYTIWSDVYRCEGFITIEEPTGKISKRGKNFGQAICSKKRVARGCGNDLFLWAVAVDHQKGEVLETITCSYCNQHWKKQQMQLKGSRPAVVAYSYQSLAGNHVMVKRRPTTLETKRLETIEFAKCPYPFPTDRMPLGRQTRKTMSGKGIYTVDGYYYPRSRWALARLKSEIQNIENASIRNHLMWAMTAILSYASRMNRHNFGSQPSPLRGTFYVSSFVEEANVLRLLSGKMKTLIRSLEHLRPFLQDRAVEVVNGTATALLIPDESIDYIYTDPPFGEALQYAELNFIWEAWLGQYTDIKQDCVVNYVHGKDLDFYAKTMRNAFSEMCRVLKPGRWASVVFKNTDDKVWDAIKSAATNAGFDLVNALEFDKEQRTFNQVNRTGAAGTDVVMNLLKPLRQSTNGQDLKHGGVELVWKAINEYLRSLSDLKKKDPTNCSDFNRTTSVLHSVVIKTFLSQNLSVEGVNIATIETVCARYLKRFEGKWYFRGEAVGSSNDRGMLDIDMSVTDEASAITWLRRKLSQKPATEGELNTDWKVATLKVNLDKTLDELLSEHFWRDVDSNRWREPTAEEREKMNDDRSLSVLHDSERFLNSTLRRQTTDEERCEWIEVLFRACRAIETNEAEALPALRGFDADKAYIVITRLFQSVLRDHVSAAAFARAGKQNIAASRKLKNILDKPARENEKAVKKDNSAQGFLGFDQEK